MPFEANITPARVNAGGFMIVRDAFARIEPGLVRIRLGPGSSDTIECRVDPLDGGPRGYCYCRQLYHTDAGNIRAPLPLRLGDRLVYEVESRNIICLHQIRRDAQEPDADGEIPAAATVDPDSGSARYSVVPHSTGVISDTSPSCDSLTCQFLEKLASRKNSRVDLSRKVDWMEGAFTASAGQGNPEGSVLTISPSAKACIDNCVTQFFMALANEAFCGQSRFDWLFLSAVKGLQDSVAEHSSRTSFTFGRAQKILTIVLKYCYAWWLCKRRDSPKFGDVSWVDKWRPFLHIPVDGDTIGHLYRILEFRDLVGVQGEAGYLSWKWKMTEYSYLGIQDAIRKLSIADGLDPMCYEMKYIWGVKQR